MSGMEWEAFGGICVGLVVWGFAKHIYYVVKNVWLVKRALDKPQRLLPPPGVVTLNGIVSTIGENCPVQVTIVEHGYWSKARLYWRQTSCKVEAHTFALLLPDLGTRIIVEPGEKRAVARVGVCDRLGRGQGSRRGPPGANGNA